jgi:hypothetical protein
MKQKKPPKVKDPAPMPDEEEIRRKRRKEMSEKAAMSGRQSTIMSDIAAETETLG